MKYWMTLLVMIFLLFMEIPAIAEINSNTRLLQKPEWDGAVISGKWINGEVRFQRYEYGKTDANFLVAGPTFALSIPQVPQLELGTRLWLAYADYKNFDDEAGFSDIDCWAKFQFLNRNNLQIAGGLMLTLPSGDDDIYHPRASGEVNFEAFGAARYHATKQLAIIGHFGFRKNGDMDVDVQDTGKVELDGETQIEIGGGVICQLQRNINLLTEFNLATEAYDGQNIDDDIELTAGLEIKPQQNLSIRGGIGLGLDDGAPDIELIIGFAATF